MSKEEFPENWKSLANAIIIQACRDYMLEPGMRSSIEKFIKSKYFNTISRGAVPPEQLISFLRTEVKQNGEKNLYKKANF